MGALGLVPVLGSLWAAVFHTNFLQILVVNLLLKVDFFNICFAEFGWELAQILMVSLFLKVDFFNCFAEFGWELAQTLVVSLFLKVDFFNDFFAPVGWELASEG